MRKSDKTGGEPYFRYNGSISVVADEGYRIVNVLMGDSGHLFDEGLNFDYSSGWCYLFGMSITGSPPETIEIAIGVYQIKDL